MDIALLVMTSENDCIICPPGTFCPVGSEVQTDCSPGTIAPSGEQLWCPPLCLV